jgi:hypothetical protein
VIPLRSAISMQSGAVFSSAVLGRSACMRHGLFLLSVLLMGACPLLAQAPPDSQVLSPGSRLRVTEDSVRPTRFIGVVLTQRGDSLRLQTGGSPPDRLVLRSQVVRLEVSRGQHSRWRLGATIGLLVGTAVGVISTQGKTYDVGDNTATTQFLASVAVGGVLGAAIGAAIHTEQWQLSAWPQPREGPP